MKEVIIIAEAGVNHNGDILIAKKLIDAASYAKADYIKFQSFKADKLVSPLAKKADYQSENIGDGDDFQYNMLKKLELNDTEHRELISYCNKKNIKFFSTAFDTDGVEYLNSLKLDRFKIPSGELTNLPYLRAVAKTKLPVILSTGMASLEEVENSINALLNNGANKDELTILHCNTDYPTSMSDVNLKAMTTMAQNFGINVGYSDHTLGIEVPIAAVSLGATVIEKHFTLDRRFSGPDHKASIEPNELKKMVESIRNIEKAISGSGLKEPSKSELKNIVIARKSIHLSTNLEKGAIIMEKDLIPLRPGDGICPMNWDNVIGKKINKTLKKYAKIDWKDLS